MLVLDFVRETSATSPSIMVPRIHAGHLGLLPETRVYVSTPPVPSRQSDMRTEVVITPFQTTTDNTALVSVVLHDAVGVVRSLVQALSWRNINIEVQESSSIDHLDLHRVGMIVDLGNKHQGVETSERVQHEYQAYAANVPIHSRRYLELFDMIVAHCGHALWWHPYEKGPQARLIPALYVRPLYRREALNPSSVVLKPSDDKLHTEIKLPDDIRDLIRLRLADGADAAQQVSYIFVSDTNDRTLRAHFLPETRAKSLVHVGIYHRDQAGTLARVLDVIATSQFNIVTSLLRKHSKERSVWEAVLEYQGKDEKPPAKPDRVEQLPTWYCKTLVPWIQERLRMSPQFQQLEGCDVSIGPPRYPPQYGGAKPENMLDLSQSGKRTEDQMQSGNTMVMSLLVQRHNDLRRASRAEDETSAATGLIATVARHRDRMLQRTLFLSYPKTAADVVDSYLRSELEPPLRPSYYLTELQDEEPRQTGVAATTRMDEPFYDLTQLQKPKSGNIQEEAIALIREADYFLAIWHPEDEEDGQRCQPAKISPWMFFEYGVARALNKPCVVACHNDIKKVINPPRLVGLKKLVTYTDATFAQKVSDIRRICTEVFDDDREALFNDDR